MRAADPAFARNKRDAQFRSRKRAQLRRELMQIQPEQATSVLPGFRPMLAGTAENYYALPIDPAAIEMLVIKIVKGLAFLYDGSLIGKTHMFDVIQRPDPNPEIMDAIRKHGARADSGPGIISEWAFVPNDPASRMHYLCVWGRWHMYVFSRPQDPGKLNVTSRIPSSLPEFECKNFSHIKRPDFQGEDRESTGPRKEGAICRNAHYIGYHGAQAGCG